LQAVSRDLREIKAIRETPERPDLLDLLELPDLLDLPDLQASRELPERTFRFTSIQRMAPVRVLMKLL
jgi:hypothetical protein